MVRIKTPLGGVVLTSEYFSNLVGGTVTGCYGVKGMATRGPIEGLRAVLMRREFPEKGVRVTEKGGKLVIDLHIKVVYGVNISAIAESISEKVRYAVEQATGLSVNSIRVYVDEMDSE